MYDRPGFKTYEILSKRCTKFSIKKEKLDESMEEFKDCGTKNNSMLVEPGWINSNDGARGRSEKLHRCYTAVISAGDSTTTHLYNVHPYGDQVNTRVTRVISAADSKMTNLCNNVHPYGDQVNTRVTRVISAADSKMTNLYNNVHPYGDQVNTRVISAADSKMTNLCNNVPSLW